MKLFKLSENHQELYDEWKRTNVPRLAMGLGVLFVLAGIPKLLGLSFVSEEFSRWHYPGWFVHFTGLVEITAGAMMLTQRMRYWGTMIILAVMIAALITHLKFDYYIGQLIMPIAILFLVSYVFRHLRHERRLQHVNIYLTEPRVTVKASR